MCSFQGIVWINWWSANGSDALVLSRVDKETMNCFFAKRFGGFEPMQAFDEYKPSAIRAYQNRRLLALLQHARGDFVYALLIKRGTPLHWYVDVCDRDGLALHHAGITSAI
jgi:hypothetical protein